MKPHVTVPAIFASLLLGAFEICGIDFDPDPLEIEIEYEAGCGYVDVVGTEALQPYVIVADPGVCEEVEAVLGVAPAQVWLLENGESTDEAYFFTGNGGDVSLPVLTINDAQEGDWFNLLLFEDNYPYGIFDAGDNLVAGGTVEAVDDE